MMFSRFTISASIYLCLTNFIFAADLDFIKVSIIKVDQVRVVDASIEAVNQATVTAQTNGRIMEINVDVDDYVEKGQVIIRLRDTQQRASYNSAKAQYEAADAEYKRVKEIYGKKLIAKAELDKAKAKFKSTKASLEQATEALEYTLIRAPYSGIVVKRHVQVGENARAGQQLMTGLTLEQLRAKVNLPQSIVHTVRKYKQAWVYVGTDLTTKLEAKSITISPFADETTHTFLVRVNLPAGDHKVYPGMYTRVAFYTGEEESLAIPRGCVVYRSEVTGVYVLSSDNTLVFRHVRLGRDLQNDYIEVLSGLHVDEQVAADPILATARMIHNHQNKVSP